MRFMLARDCWKFSRQNHVIPMLYLIRIPNSVNTPELKVQVSEEEKFLIMEKLVASAEFFHSAGQV